jgi:hypothetical protein
MATVYNATNYSQPPGYDFPYAGVSICREFSFLVATALVINDTINLISIPAGVFLEDFFISFPDLDSGTSLTWDIGDSGLATRYISAGTQGQAAGTLVGSTGAVAFSLPHYYSAADNLIAKVHAAPAGAGSNTISMRGFARYHYATNNPAFPDVTH